MKNSKLSPERLLDTQELSALENQSLVGGCENGKEKKKEKKVEIDQ